jgi:transposase
MALTVSRVRHPASDADGPLVDQRKTWLWCAWLAWSRFRVVLPIRDKTLPTVIACIDVTLRRFGGVPTYGLSDNEKTLSVDHIARIAVRNPTMVEVGRYYGLTLASCVPADPQSKGGSEATVRIASPLVCVAVAAGIGIDLN